MIFYFRFKGVLRHSVKTGRFYAKKYRQEKKKETRIRLLTVNNIQTSIPTLKSFQMNRSPLAFFGILSRLTSLPCRKPAFFTTGSITQSVSSSKK